MKEQNTNKLIVGANEIITILFRLAPHVKISRHSIGRITLHFMLSGYEVIRHMDLQTFIFSIPGVYGAKTSLIFRTITITYDPQIFPSDLWESLIYSVNDPGQEFATRERLRELFENYA